MPAVILHPLIICAAKQIQKEEFSVDRFTETYMALDGCPHVIKKSARQYIYRNMLRLLSNGELEKMKGQNGWPIYRFTKKFQARPTPSDAVEPSAAPVKTPPNTRDELKNLRERLKVIKLEMLTAMGEVEEYNTLESELPGMKKLTQKLAAESRDRCSKLLGKVKAIETLLNAESR